MKSINLILLAVLFISLYACTSNNDAEWQAKIEKLEVKLTATEAQLMNVSAELAKCKQDSTGTELSDTLATQN